MRKKGRERKGGKEIYRKVDRERKRGREKKIERNRLLLGSQLTF